MYLIAAGAAGSASGGGDAGLMTPFETFAQQALFFSIDFGIVAIVVAVLMCLYRILTGPTLVDRGIAGDTVAVLVTGLVLLLTIRVESIVIFDAVLVVAFLGFVSTLAFAQYVARRGEVS